MRALAEEHTHVGTKKFVSRAHQKIAVQRRDIDRSVRPVVDRIDVG